MPKGCKGSTIRRQSRIIISNVASYFQRERNENRVLHPVEQVQVRTAEATGVSLNSIKRIQKEVKEAEEMGKSYADVAQSPGKSRSRPSPITELDSFQLEAIRRRLHQFYMDKELPTLEKLLETLRQVDDITKEAIYSGSHESLRKVLKNQLGFEYKKVDSRKHLMERTDVVARRRQFLKKVRNIDLKDNVVFLDETWVNEHHTVSKCWQSEEVTGPKVPSGKGKRLIVVHAGSSKGFVENGLLIFPSKSGLADYHDDMNAKCFKEWFVNQLLPNIKNATIFMDNASYHSVILDKAPTTATRKSDMQKWLEEHDIPYEKSLLKAELYEIIKLHKSRTLKYEIDEIAESRGHKVVRIPPYHCQFNPIELIWAQVKNEVARENSGFRLSTVKDTTMSAIKHVTSENWLNAIKHVEKIIQEYWDKDPIIESTIEPLIINLQDDSDDSEEDVN